MSKPENLIKRTIKSFVLRNSRITEAQARALNTLSAEYTLLLSAGLLPAVNHRVLEIGFGHGASLLAMAEAAPELEFIGVEVHRPGIGSLLLGIEALNLKNLRVYQADANDVLNQCIADHSLHRIQIYFPDPWPKKKHHKRRLIQSEFAALLQRKLQRGGTLHLATDWQDYAQGMLSVLDATPGLQNVAGLGEFSPKPDYRPETKFERRGKNLGHGVWDLVYCAI